MEPRKAGKKVGHHRERKSKEAKTQREDDHVTPGPCWFSFQSDSMNRKDDARF